MRVVPVISIALVGCGRLGFAPLDPAPDGDADADVEGVDPTPFATAPPCACTRVAGGAEHSCVRLETGAVRCWGHNFRGQLGDTTQVDSLVPVAVAGLPDALDVFAGGSHNCARRPGSITCWGEDVSGQLGNGTGGGGGTLETVSGISAAVHLDASRWHTCFVTAVGTASCTGLNNFLQLVDGTGAGSRTQPVGVVGISDAQSGATGEYFTCFRRATGTVECAGDNERGQLGDGTQIPRGTLAPVNQVDSVAEVVAGRSFACARRSSGDVRCWGENTFGQLGNGTLVDSTLPVVVSGLSDAVALAAGQNFVCAIRATGTLACWGTNMGGTLGIGIFGNRRETPVDVLHLKGVSALEAGDLHVCAISEGGLYCWGSNQYGQLGDATKTAHAIATPVSGF